MTFEEWWQNQTKQPLFGCDKESARIGWNAALSKVAVLADGLKVYVSSEADAQFNAGLTMLGTRLVEMQS